MRISKKERYSYVNINDNLRYFLSATDFSFLIKLKQLSYRRSIGLRTAYSTDYNLKNFQIKREAFYKSIKKLEQLGLLKRTKIGVYIDYLLIEENYNRLLEIATATNNVSALITFNKREFILKEKSIDQILDKEIIALRERGDSSRKL